MVKVFSSSVTIKALKTIVTMSIVIEGNSAKVSSMIIAP